MASTMIREKGKRRGFRIKDLQGKKGDTPTGESIPWKCELTGNPERREVWTETYRFEYADEQKGVDGKPIPHKNLAGDPMDGRYKMGLAYATTLDNPNLPDPKTIDGFVKFDVRADGVYVVREFIVTDHLNGTTSKVYLFRADPKAEARKAEQDARDKALAKIGSLPAEKLDALFEALVGPDED